MKALASGSLLLAAAVLSPSCTPADVTDPFAQVCEDYAYAYCQRLAACSSTAIQLRYGTSSTCVSGMQGQCALGANAPSSGSTPAGQAGCTQALPMWGCSDFLNQQNVPPACRPPMGALPDGAPCAVRQQCQSGFCGYAPGRLCGTCGPPVPAGASCAETSCPEGLACVGTPPACQPHALVGQPCGKGISCVAGLSCIGGACQPAVTTAGAPCAFTSSDNACDINAGLVCSGVTGACQTVKLASTGNPCNITGEAWTYCTAGRCLDGACTPLVPPGGACTVIATTGTCVAPAVCISGDGGTTGTCQYRGSASCG